MHQRSEQELLTRCVGLGETGARLGETHTAYQSDPEGRAQPPLGEVGAQVKS